MRASGFSDETVNEFTILAIMQNDIKLLMQYHKYAAIVIGRVASAGAGLTSSTAIKEVVGNVLNNDPAQVRICARYEK